MTAKVFACLYHVVNYYGDKKDGKIIIQWNTVKKLAQRLFAEPPSRLEQAFNVCVKLKLAEVKMVKADNEPDTPEEMGPCTFHDLKPVERFFEFYQNYHFKGSSAAILKYDEKCRDMVQAMLQVSEGEKMDKAGVVYMNYKDACDKLRVVMGPTFNAEHILRLEQKGLFVKRQSSATGGTLSFIRTEFLGMLECWKVLREVEKWNELGFVDLKEGQAKPAAAAGAAPTGDKPVITCSTCLTQVAENAKFCQACGAKLAAAAA